jgi:hypothetical protein
LICEVGINAKERWQHKQRQTILSNYRKAPCWSLLEAFFDEVFTKEWQTISELNIHVVRKLAELLGITTPLHIASELPQFPEDPDERLIAITRHFGAATYLAGSGGHGYMDLAKYESAGIELVFQEFHHPEYTQMFGDFEPFMSVVDLIFNHGPDSIEIIRRGR